MSGERAHRSWFTAHCSPPSTCSPTSSSYFTSLFVLFVVLGGLLVLRWPWVAYLHVPTAIWGALIEFMGWVCPLTPLEKRLREDAGLAGYEGGFVEHYILPALYPSALTRGVQIVLGSLVIGVNLAIYARVLRSRRIFASGRKASPGSSEGPHGDPTELL